MSGIISQNVGRTSGLVKAVAAAGGTWTLIKTLTASADSDLSFVDGSDDVTLDSTYPICCFRFTSIHPETDNTHFGFNLTTDGGSNFNVTKTTSIFYARHKEDDSATALTYDTSRDLAQETGDQYLFFDTGADADQAHSGELYLFNPSSTTFVKHFLAVFNSSGENDWSYNTHIGGYANTTSAVDGARFMFNSGNIDAGKIKLYGIGDS